ncbi:MAG: 2-amino-4-hydroxy-6-hydroxymethyldihydropteridine diphosphokinase [Prevotellaceae bacterium]|jgi:2-amino-4-hydroxy-6-hydroxymethyldihydropteridine diphosphokinase|nr:2-amino-4-hydroxy-6-hydroxymethyldihydropteridine diphosphokinase [Prevotellaceae bacterium]
MNNDLHRVYLLAGSNKGNKRGFLEIAEQSLSRLLGQLIKKSAIYESEPWGFEADERFVNQALLFETLLQPSETLKVIAEIERRNGRIRPSGGGYASRTLDIDILFYDNLILNTPDLQIPHPLLHLRAFALIPLCEIAPTLVHPVLNCTIEAIAGAQLL